MSTSTQASADAKRPTTSSGGAQAPPPASSTSTTTLPTIPTIPPNTREKRNWLVHILYVRRDFDQCLAVIEEQLNENKLSEYPLYIKALIKRQRGDIAESLVLFQQASLLNPGNIHSLKQIARSLYLLGKHKEALGILESVEKIAPEDWEVWHNKGLCLMYIKEYDKAAESLKKANQYAKHDSTFLLLARLYALQENYKQAIEILVDGLETSPENPEILTTLGLLYLRVGENYKAFDYFGNSLTFDPKNPKTILAAGSIIQDHSEVEVALIKYRIAAVATPNSPQLWNNVGMCFFGKQKYVAAIASLKKALYLAPFEWIISFNLGYEKAIALETDHVFEINYAITLYNKGNIDKSKQHFAEFERLFAGLDEESKNADSDILEKRQQMLAAFTSA